jgi:WS/DGAT C-terminal domain
VADLQRPVPGRALDTAVRYFSYLGGLNFGVTADYDSAPDIEVLCDGIEAVMREYLAIAGAGGSNGTAGNGRSGRRVPSASRKTRKHPAPV